MRWKAFFFDRNEQDNNDATNNANFGFKSRKVNNCRTSGHSRLYPLKSISLCRLFLYFTFLKGEIDTLGGYEATWLHGYGYGTSINSASFDIDDSFYPSITESLLSKEISFAKNYTTISDKDIDVIMHCRKSLLFDNETAWT